MKKDIKLFNVFFPIWLLWLMPWMCFVALPVNFLIDTAVLLLTLKFLKVDSKEIKGIYKKTILPIWSFGFLSDIIGTIIMFTALATSFGHETEFGNWWYESISSAVATNPFDNIFSFLWVMICVAIAGFFIYLFNYKISFKKLALEDKTKKKIALSIAIFTAPYLFLLPSTLLYNMY